MPEHKVEKPKRRNRAHRIMIDYMEACFHQNQEIINLLKEIRDLFKTNCRK